MNVQKTAFFLLAAGLVVSCNTFKPAAKSPVNNNLAAAESSISPQKSPRFIEGLEVAPRSVTVPRKTAATTLADSKITGSNLVQQVHLSSGAATAHHPSVESMGMLQLKYAIALDVPAEQITNLSLYSLIDDWYGTRYRFGGTTKNGIDCSSLMQKIYETVYGREIPRTAVNQYAATSRISKDELQEGDLIFFHTTRKGISHVGLYLGNNRFVHASSSRGVIISDLTESYYVNAYRASGRFTGVEMARREDAANTGQGTH